MSRTQQTTEVGRIAHLLRRSTFGPAPGRLNELEDAGYEAILDELLDPSRTLFEESPFGEPVTSVPEGYRTGDDVDFLRWWIAQMASPDQGLHERMVWFWHSHFTTNRDKVATIHLVNQHELIRRHALGNVRDLVQGIVTDGAMLLYLDGAGSNGAAPNENLARELMELFTLGRGNYTESDVRAVARGLSGWWVDWETGDVGHDPESGYAGAIELLGERGRFNAEDVADLLCDHPACPPHIAGRLYEYFVGSPPSDEVRAELAHVLASSDLDIQPLVSAILRHSDFEASILGRPRFAIEWFLAAGAVLQTDPGAVEDHVWMLDLLGQGPFSPPNVGGWPGGERWISPSLVLGKINTAFWMDDGEDWPELPFPEDDPVPAALRWCGLADVSAATRQVLDDAYWAPLDAQDVNHLLLHLIIHSPEFALA